MPTYVWTCAACGNANAPSALRCTVCDCPAVATVKQMRLFRGQHLASGGEVLPAAAYLDEREFGSLGATEVLLDILCLLLFGFAPSRLKRRTSSSASPIKPIARDGKRNAA